MIVDLFLYGVATVLFLMRRYVSMKTKLADVKMTDLGHVALAVVAANSLTVSPYGALASVMMTALYVIYQWWQDKNPKDVAVYTGAFAAVIATKFGISVTGL